VKPRKNKDAMNDVIAELREDGLFYGDKVRVKKDEHSDTEGDDDVEEEVVEKKRDKKSKDKKDKKDKKKKVKEVEEEESDEELEKKKKKDKKRSKH